MSLLFISFIAGVLTVLAPCVLPLIPIIIGRSIEGDFKHRPIIVTASLSISIVLFTLILKASTAFISVPQHVWSLISGGIIILFGLTALFPTSWEKITEYLKIGTGSQKLLARAAKNNGVASDIAIGAALGPVFSSCSPTYFLILATVLPQNYFTGIVYLIVYALGLSLMLLLISLLGKRLVKRLMTIADAQSRFKKALGIIFILVGLFIVSGLDKKVQAFIVTNGYFDITKFEQQILTQPMEEKIIKQKEETSEEKLQKYSRYQEIVQPHGFVNTEKAISLKNLVGKKVILLDFVTYSCINCQRTFPYLNAWHETYGDKGLEIIGIHTPEFAFEHKIENVREAAKKFGLKFPLVLDNDYATWNAYGNNYWPRKYLIDIDGYVVYDHIGEGAYTETESKIQDLLRERKIRLEEESQSLPKTLTQPEAEEPYRGLGGSPETYFGSLRNKNPGIIEKQEGDIITFKAPERPVKNKLYLIGKWKITDEYAQAYSQDAKVLYRYKAQKVFLVADAGKPITTRVLEDMAAVKNAGSDMKNGTITIQNEDLYRIIENTQGEDHLLEIYFDEPGVRLYAFTFG